MGIVIHGVDAPGIARAVMLGAQNAVHHRVAHVDIGRGHIDLCPQRAGAVRKLPCAHAAEQIKIFLHGPVAVRALNARLGERAAILPDLFSAQIADKGLAGLYELIGIFVELLKIIRGIKHAAVPVKPEPAHILLDRVDILHVFLARVGVVKPQIA